MPNCKICGRPVPAGTVMHGDCLERLITEVAEQLETHCNSCPMDQLMKLAKGQRSVV